MNRKIAFHLVYNSFEDLFGTDVVFDPDKHANHTLWVIRKALHDAGYDLIDLNQIDSDTFACITDFPVLNIVSRYPRCKHIYLTLEPEIIRTIHSNRGLKILTTIYDYILTTFKEPLGLEGILLAPTGMRIFNTQFINDVPFLQKKLAAIIIANKKSFARRSIYNEREKVILWFAENHSEDLDYYGTERWHIEALYKGEVESKLETYKNYRFAICFENARIPGYITEKIFDCFEAKCVPVYYGDPTISQAIPNDCFIDYTQFSSMDECYHFLKNMTENEYDKYLEAIDRFHLSQQCNVFSIKLFIQILLKVIESPKRVFPSRFNLLRAESAMFMMRVSRRLTVRFTRHKFFRRWTH